MKSLLHLAAASILGLVAFGCTTDTTGTKTETTVTTPEGSTTTTTEQKTETAPGSTETTTTEKTETSGENPPPPANP
jgi:hypothetical protein